MRTNCSQLNTSSPLNSIFERGKSMKRKNHYLGYGIAAFLFGIGILCWRANEQYKRDLEEAERYHNLMHDLADPILSAFDKKQIVYIFDEEE